MKPRRTKSSRVRIETLETRLCLDGEGLSAIYFNNGTFTGTNITRVETVVDAAWNNTTPGAGIGTGFSSRFAGRVTAVESGNYVFSVQVGGSVRLWVDDILRIDQFTSQTATHATAPIALTAGKSYHIVLEYRATGSATGSTVRLMWTRPGQSVAAVIPQSQLSSDNRVFPTGAFASGTAGFFNVKTLFGAAGDGITDDTDAINLGIDFVKGSSWGGSLYFPSGTYRVTSSIDYVSAANTVLRGQNRDNVVIKLDNAAPGFTNIASPKPLLTMFSIAGGNTGNQFGNSIFDMTFDTGANNPGAIGINWLNNNQGSMRDVTVRSSDATRRGVTGVDLSSPWPGPALFTNVLVEGFNYAFRNTGQFNYSQTFDQVRIQNQLVNGVYNNNGSMFFRNLRSINSVTAILNVNDSGNFLVIDSELTGGSASVPAMINYGSATLRNVNTAGYSTALGPFWSLPAYVTEFATGAEYVGNGPFSGFNVRNGGVGFAPTSFASIRLPVEEAPRPVEDPTSQWVAVNFSASDDTANIQAAFNTAAAQGRSTVYFPKSTYNITGPISIGGSVRRVIGLGSALNATGSYFNGGGTLFTFASTLTGPLTFENFLTTYESSGNLKFIEDRSPNTVYLRNLIVGGDPVYNNVGTGVVAGKKLFIEDVTMAGFVLNGLKVWGRQLNTEGRSTSIINNGSDLVILGLKMEGIRTIIDNRAGGRAELFGAYIYPVPLAGDPPLDPNTPAFINTDSSMNITVAGSWNDNWVREVRGGVTQTLTSAQTIGPAGFRKIPLYSSYVIPGSVAAASGLTATATSAASITLRWTDNATNESGFTIERRTAGGTFSPVGTVASDATAFSDFGLSSSTQYFYRVLATGSGTVTYSAEASAVTQAGPPAAPGNLAATSSAVAASISLNWTDNSADETGFRVERSPDGVAWTLLNTTGPNVTTYTDATAVAGMINRYRVRATNALGDSANTSVVAAIARPAAPALAVGSDTGANTTDLLTRLTSPAFTGSAEPLSTVRLFVGGFLAGSTTANALGTYTLTPTNPVAAGSRTATVIIASPGISDSPTSAGLTITIDNTAPVATPLAFAPGTQQVTFSYTENISPSLAPADYVVRNITTGVNVSVAGMSVAYNAGTNVSTLSFPSGRLASGNYQLTLLAPGVEDAAGNPLSVGRTFSFYVLTGDANLDRRVDDYDLLLVTAAQGLTPATYTQGDLDGDNAVTALDLALVQANLNRSLREPRGGGSNTRGGGASSSDTTPSGLPDGGAPIPVPVPRSVVPRPLTAPAPVATLFSTTNVASDDLDAVLSF